MGKKNPTPMTDNPRVNLFLAYVALPDLAISIYIWWLFP